MRKVCEDRFSLPALTKIFQLYKGTAAPVHENYAVPCRKGFINDKSITSFGLCQGKSYDMNEHFSLLI